MKIEEKSIRWIKNNINNCDDVDFPFEAYYKAPIALFLGGEELEAKKIITKMKKAKDMYRYSDNYTIKRRCDNYYNYWLFLYYYFAKRADIKEVYDILLESYSDTTGGFTSIQNEKFYELRATAFGGICAFLMEDTELGRKTADFIIQLYEKNEDPAYDFYLIQDKNNDFYTEYPIEHERFYNYHVTDGRPLYYSLSLAIVNLCLAYMNSKDEIYIEYAKKYFDTLIISGKEAIFNNYIGKFGIASVLMYINTKEELYRNYYEQVNNYLTNTQNVSGCWEDSTADYILALDRTSEFTASIHIMNKISSKFEMFKNLEEKYVRN